MCKQFLGPERPPVVPSELFCEGARMTERRSACGFVQNTPAGKAYKAQLPRRTRQIIAWDPQDLIRSFELDAQFVLISLLA